MGGDLSKAQKVHLGELREITRKNYFYFTAKKLTKGDLRSLLEYIWKHIPSYPETGSIKIETWRTAGDFLHTNPRAPAPILTTWRAVFEALQTQEQPLLKPLLNPPHYNEVQLLPPAVETPTTIKNHSRVSPSDVESCDPILNATAPAITKTSNLIQETLQNAYEAGELGADEMANLYPVTVGMDVQMNPVRQWAPLQLRTLREIKQAVLDYGLKSKYCMGILEALGYAHRMIPADWKALMQMILTPAQYAVWDSQYRVQAIQRGTTQLVADQIYGSGNFTAVDQQRDAIPDEALHGVILQAVFAALKVVDESGKFGKSFTQIKQGTTEPYDEFINRLKDSIDKQIDNELAAQEILMKLAVENANADCKRVLQPLIGTGQKTLADLIQACRVVGSHAYQMENLAMAITRSNKPTGNCFYSSYDFG